jgi:hypothetical protein
MKAIKKIIEAAKRLVAFVKSILSERDGSGSASRAFKLMIGGSCCLCLVLVTVWNRQLPSPDQLKALAEVIGAGSAAYIGNVAARALKARGGQDEASGEQAEGPEKPS